MDSTWTHRSRASGSVVFPTSSPRPRRRGDPLRVPLSARGLVVVLRERKGLPGLADAPHVWVRLPPVRVRRVPRPPLRVRAQRLSEVIVTGASGLLGLLLGQLLF